MTITTDKKPHRRLCRRQKYLRVPIGVNFRQQHLQRAMSNAVWCVKVKVAAMKTEMKRLNKSLEKDRVGLREMEAKFTQLRAERVHALEEREQVCLDTMEALLFAQAIGEFALADELRASLRSLMMT